MATSFSSRAAYARPVRREANLPPVFVQVGEGNFQVIIGEQAGDAVGPLDHDDFVFREHIDQAYIPHLRRRVA